MVYNSIFLWYNHFANHLSVDVECCKNTEGATDV